MARTVAGIFPDRPSVEHAIVDLKAAGFDPQRMGVVMRDRSDAREVAEDQGISSTVGAVTGGVLGGTAGALLAATGALAIPGIGPFITGGVLASLVGGTAGWLVGGLVGLGVARDEAQYYQNRVEQGGILLTVDPDGREEESRRIMFANGGEAMQPQRGEQHAGSRGYEATGAGRAAVSPAGGVAAPGSSVSTMPSNVGEDTTLGTMADTRRGMSREMLSGTMPNIPPDATRVPRQESASDVVVNDQPLPAGGQRTLHVDQAATGYDESRQSTPRRPAMDEDIIQGRTHGTVGDEDVVTDRREQGTVVPGTDAIDERDQRMLDEQSGRGRY